MTRQPPSYHGYRFPLQGESVRVMDQPVADGIGDAGFANGGRCSLIRGMNLRLHPRSVAPAEGPEKCGPRRPTCSGYSCNNASVVWPMNDNHEGPVPPGVGRECLDSTRHTTCLSMLAPNVRAMMRAIRGQPNRGVRDVSSTSILISP